MRVAWFFCHVLQNECRPLLHAHYGNARRRVPEAEVCLFDRPVKEDRHSLVFRAHVVFLEGKAVKEEDVSIAVDMGGEWVGEPLELVETNVGGAAGEADVEDERLSGGEAAFPLNEEVDDSPLEGARVSPHVFEWFSPREFHFGERAGDFRNNAQAAALERVDGRRFSRGRRAVDDDPARRRRESTRYV